MNEFEIQDGEYRLLVWVSDSCIDLDNYGSVATIHTSEGARAVAEALLKWADKRDEK